MLQALGTIRFRFLQKKSKKKIHACVPLTRNQPEQKLKERRIGTSNQKILNEIWQKGAENHFQTPTAGAESTSN